VYGYYGGQALVNQLGISTNPCDQADRLKATQYIGSYYNADELKTMIEKFDGDPMRLPVILTAYYGLIRSEVLGLKWDAIDYSEKKIVIRLITGRLCGGDPFTAIETKTVTSVAVLFYL